MLNSLRIAVPRTSDRTGPIVDALRARGATVHDISMSLLEMLPIEPLQEATRKLSTYEWVLLADSHCVTRYVQAARNTNTAYLNASRKLALAGTGTISEGETLGWTATVQVDNPPYEMLLDLLATRSDVEGSAFLYPATIGARDVIPDGIRALGAHVDVVPTCRYSQDPAGVAALRQLIAHGEVDLIAATTTAVVDALLEAIPAEQTQKVRLACIGPITARAARSGRLSVAVEATVPSIDAMIAAISAFAARRV